MIEWLIIFVVFLGIVASLAMWVLWLKMNDCDKVETDNAIMRNKIIELNKIIYKQKEEIDYYSRPNKWDY